MSTAGDYMNRDTGLHSTGWNRFGASSVDPTPRTLVLTERKVRGGFALALACLGLVGAVSFWSAVRLDDAVAWVARSQEAISSGNMLLSDITDAETEERGYIITGDESHLNLFRDALGRSEWELKWLGELIGINPDSRTHLDTATPLIAERLRNLSRTVELRRTQGADAASNAIASGPDRGLHDAILFQIGALIASEMSLLGQRQSAAQRTSAVTKAVILGGSAFAATVVGFVLFGLRRDFAHRMRTELRMSATQENLEARVRDHTEYLEQLALDMQAEAVARREAQEKLVSQIERLNLLHQITRAIGERQDLPSIYSVVVETLEAKLPLELCCICSFDAEASELTVLCASTSSDAVALDDRIAVEADGLSQLVGGELIYAQDLAKLRSAFSQRLLRHGLRSMVAAPLQDESKVVGLLLCARRSEDCFGADECEFLRQLSEHVALAAHQTELRDALRKAYDEVRQSQREALQLERLRVLGQLASGIAHDINNTISPVTLYIESLLEEEQDLTPKARRQIEIIRRGVSDVAQTVSQMRDFSRHLEPQANLSPVDLNVLIGQVVELTRARWSDMPQQRGVVIELSLALESGLPVILGIEAELRDALVNLVFNGVDAMPRGGPLILRTSSLRMDALPGRLPASFVRLEVTDSGIGMDDDTRRRCMEPFFTTKGERGTGLGLAMVYGTMQRHGADIEIDSVPGKGTTFRFSFPTPAASLADPITAAIEAVAPLDILLVDDDPLVSGAVCETLCKDGHRVTIANGGQAGIDAFMAARAAGQGYHVVITDMGMPHVDGQQVADAVKAAEPSAHVMLLTGWGQRLLADGEKPQNIDCVLSKPPTRARLRSALGRCSLAGAAPSSEADPV